MCVCVCDGIHNKFNLKRQSFTLEQFTSLTYSFVESDSHTYRHARTNTHIHTYLNLNMYLNIFFIDIHDHSVT